MLRLLNALLVAALGYQPTCVQRPQKTAATAQETMQHQPTTTTPNTLLRMQHMQIKGTHNSYHIAPPHAMVSEWLYSHAPIEVQLSQQGVRQLEFDLYYNPETHTFTVAHIPLIDAWTQCHSLSQCLQKIHTWSTHHQGHLPVFIFLEPKNFYDPSLAERYFYDLESTLTEHIPRTSFITPDNVQGNFPTLSEAIQKEGWPSLEEARNKYVVVLLDKSDFRTFYTHQHTHLRQRLMFALSSPEQPYASIIDVEDPVAQEHLIAQWVQRRFLVRARSDVLSFFNDEESYFKRMKAALNAGVHILSTDFPAPVKGLHYWLKMPHNAPSRCNPITAPTQCMQPMLENLRRTAQDKP